MKKIKTLTLYYYYLYCTRITKTKNNLDRPWVSSTGGWGGEVKKIKTTQTTSREYTGAARRRIFDYVRYVYIYIYLFIFLRNIIFSKLVLWAHDGCILRRKRCLIWSSCRSNETPKVSDKQHYNFYLLRF